MPGHDRLLCKECIATTTRRRSPPSPKMSGHHSHGQVEAGNDMDLGIRAIGHGRMVNPEEEDTPEGEGEEDRAEQASQTAEQDSQSWQQSSWWTPSASQYSSNHQMDTWLSSGELLPDFLQGWYLLMDANLDSQERNMIQTAVQGDFSLSRISQELRNQWPEDDLKKRDGSNVKATSYWGTHEVTEAGL